MSDLLQELFELTEQNLPYIPGHREASLRREALEEELLTSACASAFRAYCRADNELDQESRKSLFLRTLALALGLALGSLRS